MTRSEAKRLGLTVARKSHACDFCGQRIDSREAYSSRKYYPGEYDYDELTTFRACRWCNDAWSKQMDVLGIHECEDCQGVFDDYIHNLQHTLGITEYLHALGDRDTFRRLIERCKAENRPVPPRYIEEAGRKIDLFFDF